MNDVVTHDTPRTYKLVQVTNSTCKITVFGPETARHHGITTNWSLAQLRTQQDLEKKDSESARELATAIAGILGERRIRRAYAPHVAAMSGRVISQAALQPIRLMHGGPTLFRNPEEPADAVELKGADEAFIMSSAGCAVLTAQAGEHFFVAHAGRDSLIDSMDVEGRGGREHPSVVDALVAALAQRGVAPSDISMHLAFAIPHEAYRHHLWHEQHGGYNRQLEAYVQARWPSAIKGRSSDDPQGEYFCLDLEEVFACQARALGVVDATCEESLRRHEDLLTYTRKEEGERKKLRNLVLVQGRF